MYPDRFDFLPAYFYTLSAMKRTGFSPVRRMLCFLVFLLLTAAVFGEKKYSHTVSAGLSFNIQKGVEYDIFTAEALYRFTSPYAYVMGGLQAASDSIDALFSAAYTPLNIERHCIGLGLGYHLLAIQDVGTEHDVMPSFEYTFRIPQKFNLYLQCGYLHKWLHIPVPGFKPIVIDNASMTVAFHFEGIIVKKWALGCGMSSYETFRYPLFANPSFNGSIFYRPDGVQLYERIFAGFTCSLRYSDLFTISGYPENFVIRSVVGVRL